MSNDIKESIVRLTYGINDINKNINSIFNVTKDLSERIISLESDLKERTVRKKLYTSFYPIVLIILATTLNIDHNKIIGLIDDFNSFQNVEFKK